MTRRGTQTRSSPPAAPAASSRQRRPATGWRGKLSGALAERLERACAFARNPAADLVHAVHEQRREVRRTIALLALSRELLDERAFGWMRERAREALAATGGVRDRHVVSALLAGSRWTGLRPAAWSTLREELGPELEVRPQQARAALVRSAALVGPIAARYEAALAPGVSAEDLQRALARSFRRARRARRRAARGRTVRRAHRFRKRVKELRDQLELLGGGGRAASRTQRRLARLSKELGGLTDLKALNELVEGKLSRSLERKVRKAVARRSRHELAGILPEARSVVSKRARAKALAWRRGRARAP